MKKLILLIALIFAWKMIPTELETQKTKDTTTKNRKKKIKQKTVKAKPIKVKEIKRTNVCSYFENCEELSFSKMIQLTKLIHNIEDYKQELKIGPIVYKKIKITDLFKIENNDFKPAVSCEYKRVTNDLYEFLSKDDLSKLHSIKDINNYILKINPKSVHVCVENNAFLFLDREVRKNIFRSRIIVSEALISDLFTNDLIYGTNYPLEDFIYFYEAEYTLDQLLSKSTRNSILVILNNINFKEIMLELDISIRYDLRWAVYDVPLGIYEEFKHSGLPLYANLLDFNKQEVNRLRSSLYHSTKELI